MIAILYATASSLPFVSFFVVWFGIYWWKRDKKKATRYSATVTGVLLFGSVSVMYMNVFDSTFGFWLIVLLALLSGGAIARKQYRTKGEIDYMRLSGILLRGGFLILSVCYAALLVAGIVKYWAEG